MTVSMIVSPVMTYLDRIFIGFILSTAVVAYYATPQEMAMKLMFIPGAIVGVMFPAFAASYWSNRDRAQSIYRNMNKYMFIIMFPISLFILVLSHPICTLWIGSEFADSSYMVMQIMSVGLLFVSLANISFSLIQGAGRADITGITQLLEAPIYVVMFVYAVSEYGINGGALIWAFRLVVETIVFSLIVENKILMRSDNVNEIRKALVYGIITAVCIIGFSAFVICLDLTRTVSAMNLFIVTSVCILMFIAYAIKFMLSKEEIMLMNELLYKKILRK
jgi:O-antigen/teichoic acid export membrane protein